MVLRGDDDIMKEIIWRNCARHLSKTRGANESLYFLWSRNFSRSYWRSTIRILQEEWIFTTLNMQSLNVTNLLFSKTISWCQYPILILCFITLSLAFSISFLVNLTQKDTVSEVCFQGLVGLFHHSIQLSEADKNHSGCSTANHPNSANFKPVWKTDKN